jgi:hypothetical protein
MEIITSIAQQKEMADQQEIQKRFPNTMAE